jgi:SAM-dependent methyltransferase
MPTLPGEAHQHRQVAEGFGADAERYDRSRPLYPAALIERIAAASPGPEVLDVGTGTGIAARQFQAAGAQVLGVEPDPRMADFARASGVEAEVATFEDWDAAGRQFDAVVAGMTWHWVDPVAGAVKAAQVLRPGGRLAVFWNVFDLEPAVAEAFDAVYARVLPDLPDSLRWSRVGLVGYSGLFEKAENGLREAGGFGVPERWRYDWERTYTRDEWLDFLPTSGGFNRFPPGKQAEVLDGLGSAIDDLGGSFRMGYNAVAVTTTR